MDWNDLKIILAIGRSGSLSAAAKALDMNHSTVFRRINGIEEKMGVRFFDRLPQGYSMTEAGETATRAAERIDNEVNSLSRELLGKDLRLQGNIRVTAPEGIALKLLRPIIASFLKQHSAIKIDFVVTGSALQLAHREADLAVRVTNNPPETSIGRRICQFRFSCYASKAYIKKHKFKGKEGFDWLLLDDSPHWFSSTIWKKMGINDRQYNSNVTLRSDNTMTIVNAAIDGLGVAPLPCFLGDRENNLVRIIEPLKQASYKESAKQKPLELWLLMHPDLRHTTRVLHLKTHIYEQLQQHIPLIEGQLVRP